MAIKQLKVWYMVSGERFEKYLTFPHDTTMGMTYHQSAKIEVSEQTGLKMDAFEITRVV